MLPPPQSAPAIRKIQKTKKNGELEALSFQCFLGSRLIVKARERQAGVRRAPRSSSFCWVPRGAFVLRKETGTLRHCAPVGSSCYQPAVKCDCFCHSVDCCCCWAMQQIRAGTLAWAPRGEQISYWRGKCLLALFRQPLIWIDTSCWGGLRDKEAQRGPTQPCEQPLRSQT